MQEPISYEMIDFFQYIKDNHDIMIYGENYAIHVDKCEPFFHVLEKALLSGAVIVEGHWIVLV